MFKVIRGHRGRYQSKVNMRLPNNDKIDFVPFRSYRRLLLT